MKVLHVIGGGDIGGAKTHVLTLVKELGKHIDIKIVSLRSGVFSDEARSMGINIEVVNTGTIFRDIKRVIDIVRSENYQILHSHGAKANMFAVAVKYYAKIPVITTVHSDYKLDYMQSMPKRISFGLINKIALRFLDFYVAVSGNFKKMLIQRNFNEEKIFTVYNGIDFSQPLKEYSRKGFADRYGLKLDENDIIVGILVRMDPVKGLTTFVNAAAEVVKKHPDVKFLMGGDGKERNSLEARATALGIRENVIFPGWIHDPHEFMSSVDINVLTSLSESFPYVILEGTLFKKATVSSDVGGLSDLIENGVTGYIFKPGDYKKLAEYLINLVENEPLRKTLGQNIYDKARAQFSLESMSETQLGIYKNILQSSSGL